MLTLIETIEDRRINVQVRNFINLFLAEEISYREMTFYLGVIFSDLPFTEIWLERLQEIKSYMDKPRKEQTRYLASGSNSLFDLFDDDNCYYDECPDWDETWDKIFALPRIAKY